LNQFINNEIISQFGKLPEKIRKCETNIQRLRDLNQKNESNRSEYEKLQNQLVEIDGLQEQMTTTFVEIGKTHILQANAQKESDDLNPQYELLKLLSIWLNN
jgi:uncharacterized protein YigA (DUF484 family)